MRMRYEFRCWARCLSTDLHTRDPYGCAALAAGNDAAADTLGCAHDPTLENMCNQLNLRNLCLTQWNAVVNCLKASNLVDNLHTRDGGGNTVVPKDGVCTAEQDAFNTCMGR
jgi:hypothetical protein